MNIVQCMQPNFFWPVRCTPCSCRQNCRHAHVDRKSTLFNLIVNFFLKGVVFMFWHDIVYIELIYCVTNCELVWTWNKVAVVENAKKCRLYPTFPYLCKIASVAYTIIKQDLLLHKNTIYREWKHIWICFFNACWSQTLVWNSWKFEVSLIFFIWRICFSVSL